MLANRTVRHEAECFLSLVDIVSVLETAIKPSAPVGRDTAGLKSWMLPASRYPVYG